MSINPPEFTSSISAIHMLGEIKKTPHFNSDGVIFLGQLPIFEAI
jgi:hypothetical protein